MRGRTLMGDAAAQARPPRPVRAARFAGRASRSSSSAAARPVRLPPGHAATQQGPPTPCLHMLRSGSRRAWHAGAGSMGRRRAAERRGHVEAVHGREKGASRASEDAAEDKAGHLRLGTRAGRTRHQWSGSQRRAPAIRCAPAPAGSAKPLRAGWLRIRPVRAAAGGQQKQNLTSDTHCCNNLPH